LWVVALALALPACQAKNDYIANRAGDFTDMLWVQVMAGDGAAIKLDIFEMFQFGAYEMWNAHAAGIHHRTANTWTESISSWGLLVGFYTEQTDGIPYYTGDYGWDFVDGFGIRFSDPENPVDFLSVRAALALFAGIDVEVRIGEIFDFVVGIATFDPARDDRHTPD
jgi:hypothetical protein